MEQYDLLLSIAPKNKGEDFFLLTVTTQQGEPVEAKLKHPSWALETHENLPTGSELGAFLYNTLVEQNCWPIVTELLQVMEKNYGYGSFLLEIEAPEFFQLPWEDIFTSPELSSLTKRFRILRYLSASSSIVTRPLKLPIDVLIVSDSNKEILKILPTEDSLRYFRVAKATGVSGDRMKKLMSQFEFDIVHITGKAIFDKTNGSILLPGVEGEAIRAGELLSMLKRCGARFLILHCVDGQYAAFMHFAHLLLHKDGPTILVTSQPSELSPLNFDDAYFAIVHDNNLVSLVHMMPIETHPILLLAEGGGDVLRISMQESRLSNQYENQRLDATHVLDKLFLNANRAEEAGDRKKAEKFREHLKSLDMFIGSAREDVYKELNYDHESGGMEPLKKVEAINTEFAKRLKDMEALTKRVVNCWFRADNKILRSDEKLERNSVYNYEIQIGAALEGSIVQDTVAFPDKELSPFFSKEGIPLTIELFSTDLEIPESSAILNLPAPPDESETVSFRIKTPDRDGIVRMRVGIYYKQNLVQSLLVQSIIGNPGAGNAAVTGNTAQVDFSLSNSLTDLDRLPGRTLNIALNDSDNGTHSIYIAGSGLKDQFNFGEGEITTSIKASRNALQDTCSTRDGNGKPDKYRFEPNNIGNEKDFVAEVIKLAMLGYKLYNEIIVNKRSRAFQEKLEQSLENSGAKIQISNIKSSKLIFPWALIYDKPLLNGDKSVCPQFLADMKKSNNNDFINSQDCILNGCPNKSDKYVVCPSNFWGYKHIIEQPLPIDPDKVGNQKLETEIKAPAKSSLMMGVSLDLKDVQKHLAEIQGLGNIDVEFMETRQKIESGLPKNNRHIIYFYCHGGRSEQTTWLGIGKKEALIPSDLMALEIRWPVEHPFVFINGCHTADVTPDDFVPFNNAFAYSEAAGVLGTEISIKETLARHFGMGFLQRFLNGMSVGSAIREQRLTMLKNYNLLGLVYTPYCSADLKITHI